MTNSPVKKKRAGRPTGHRHFRFECLVDRELWEAAAKAKKESWPKLIEDKFKEIAQDIDGVFLRMIATQAIIVIEGEQKERYKLVARRLRKALNLRGASKETMIQALGEYK